ncbi:MAG: Crp/Fnr family transcriptional regulator [Candidatus Bipolaricaulia bacterium]
MSSDDAIFSNCCDKDQDCILNDRKVREVVSREHSIKPLNYDKGANVFEAGKPIVGFYIICEGAVKETSCPSIGNRITLHVFKTGDLLTSDAFLSDEEWYKTGAQTVTEAETLFIRRSVFPELMEVAGAKVGKKLAKNMRCLRKNLEFATRPALKKTAYWLVKLLPNSSNKLTISNKELAGIVGCSHVTISKKLSKLEEDDLIEKEGKELTVLNKADLREKAGRSEFG